MVCRETPVPECVRARLCDICELEATLYDKVVGADGKTRRQVGTAGVGRGWGAGGDLSGTVARSESGGGVMAWKVWRCDTGGSG